MDIIDLGGSQSIVCHKNSFEFIVRRLGKATASEDIQDLLSTPHAQSFDQLNISDG